MPQKNKPWDMLNELDVKRAALTVFGIAFVTRVILNFIFFERFGYRSVQYPEIWFYFGVARGKFQLLALDPTGIILEALNSLLGGLSVYGLVFVGITLSSLTAVFIFLLVRELHDGKTGIIAGLFYAMLSFSASITTAGFTHDIIAMPIIVLIMYFAVLTGKGGGVKTLIPMLLFIVIGASVNPMAVFGVFAVLVYFFLKKYDDYADFKNNLLKIGAIAIAIRILFYHDIINYVASLALEYRDIDLITQLENSADLAPPEMEVLFAGYNLLWLLVMVGFKAALKKKDGMSLSMLIVGLLAVSAMSKGTRVLDVGMCMVAAVGLVDMKRYQSHIPHFLMIFAITNLTLAAYYSPPGFTTTEHEIFKFLDENAEPGDTLYAKWTYGYTLQALSNMQPVSTPGHIRPEVYRILWYQDEDITVQNMEQLGVDYVLVSNEDFYYYEDSRTFDIIIKESIFPPDVLKENIGAGLIPAIKKTMIYRFLYTGDLRHFTMMGEWTDPLTGARYRLYKLEPS